MYVYQYIYNDSFLFHSFGWCGRENTDVSGVGSSDEGIVEMEELVLNGICILSEARACSKEAEPY